MTSDDIGRTVFADGVTQADDPSDPTQLGLVQFLVTVPMTLTTIYLRAHVVMNSGALETIYTEEVPMEIIVTDPCAATSGNILTNTISPIEYWVGDLAASTELGQGYWLDDASENLMSIPNYCGLKFYELYEAD